MYFDLQYSSRRANSCISGFLRQFLLLFFFFALVVRTKTYTHSTQSNKRMSSKDTKDVKTLPSKSKDGNLPTSKSESLVKQEGDSSKKDTSSTKETNSTKNTEKYDELRKKLVQQIVKKQELSKKLSNLEDSIYQKEIEYFEDSPLGNIIKGFENITKTSGGGGGGSNKRRVVYTDDDHIFSLSSVNYIKQMLKRQGQSINGSSTTKDDFDDYEDSVDPATANFGTKTGSIERSETPSSGSTPSRKRKARTFDD